VLFIGLAAVSHPVGLGDQSGRHADLEPECVGTVGVYEITGKDELGGNATPYEAGRRCVPPQPGRRLPAASDRFNMGVAESEGAGAPASAYRAIPLDRRATVPR